MINVLYSLNPDHNFLKLRNKKKLFIEALKKSINLIDKIFIKLSFFKDIFILK